MEVLKIPSPSKFHFYPENIVSGKSHPFSLLHFSPVTKNLCTLKRSLSDPSFQWLRLDFFPYSLF
jgi:hypothetical protein